MPEFTTILWFDDAGGNVEHLAEHDVHPEEAEWVIRHFFYERERSRSSDRWVVQGTTRDGRYLIVIFEYDEENDIILPVTAYDP